MNLLVKLFFPVVVAFGTVVLPQAHATLVDFNGSGTSELGSNFSSINFAETPGVGIGGSDGLASTVQPGYGNSATYTAEAFDMTGSTPAIASMLFYYEGLPAGDIGHTGPNSVVGLSLLLDPTDERSRFSLHAWRLSPATYTSGPIQCYLVVLANDDPTKKVSFGPAITLVPGHWYRFTAGFANETDAFRISGKMEDFGTSGQQSASVLSEGSWHNEKTDLSLSTRDPVLAADSSAFIRMSAYGEVVTAIDNFEFQGGQQVPEPSSAALLASAGLFVLSRRRSTRGAAR